MRQMLFITLMILTNFRNDENRMILTDPPSWCQLQILDLKRHLGRLL